MTKIVAQMRHWMESSDLIDMDNIQDLESEIKQNRAISEKNSKRIEPNWNRLMFIDVEATEDGPQNLVKGSCVVIEDGVVRLNKTIVPDDIELTTGRTMHRTNWVREVFMKEAYKTGTVVVGWDLPWTLSRLAIYGSQSWKNTSAFSLKFVASENYPNIRIQSIMPEAAFINFVRSTGDWIHWNGAFVDLRTLACALSNEDESFEKTCENWDINGSDRVRAMQDLYRKLKAEFDLHPIGKEPHQIYSAAGIGKAYLTAMGIKNNVDAYDPEVLGYAMTAYHAGRVEVRHRREVVPVVYTDITSMYPSVFTLQNLWSLLVAKEVEVYEDTERVVEMLTDVNIETLYRQDTWLTIPGLCLVQPEGDILPVKTKWVEDDLTPDDDIRMAVTPVSSKTPSWYTLADVVASKLLTGKVPKIIKALRVRPLNVQDGLKPIKLRGQVEVNPATDNLFKVAIEQRHHYKETNPTLSKFLKILANSTGYGIFVEFQTKKFDKQVQIEHFGLTQWTSKAKRHDAPRQWTNPMLGTLIAGGARLMLALMEKAVTDAGLSHAFADTDSMAIITDDPTKAHAIVKRFESLNPYSFGGSLLKIEKENHDPKTKAWRQLYCYAVSSKRYCLFNMEGNKITMRKASEHGLGHLLPVQDGWIEELWTYIVQKAMGQKPKMPSWAGKPQLAKYELTSPYLWKRYKDEPWNEQIKPFNKGILAWPDMRGDDSKRFYAPWSTDLSQYRYWSWTDDNGNGLIVGDRMLGEQPLREMGILLRAHDRNPESKFMDAGGKVCPRDYRGPLYRRPVEVVSVNYTGKEFMADTMSEVIEKDGKNGTVDVDWHWLRQQLNERGFAKTAIAAETGLSYRQVLRLLKDEHEPHEQSKHRLHRALLVLERKRTVT
ncbi:hypothetical protein LLE49_19930 [Alicyclobacillus tolerans]|uniref:hypothetical protein n=1 Tax=Alicyclobacillus tolerans TaxID=90970 RepID=UPI001F2CA679|nr:hypothetical protein [Alicyclobacillus tolerans]MCF8566993.1 hypothetical protein [Alicyclobacillus tolerans]